MIFGKAPFNPVPFSRAEFDNQAEQPLINALLLNPEIRRYYVLEADFWDSDALEVVTRTFGAGLSRIPGSDSLWRPRLEVGFNVETQLFSGPFGLGGEGRPAFGVMQIAIGDEGELAPIIRDEMTWLRCNRRGLRLYLGGHPDDGWEWSDYTLMFSGLAEEAIWDEDRFTFIVRDPTVRLDVPIQSTLYAGTGADEGEDDLKGHAKPICYGMARNASPVLVDRTYLIFQVNDGEVPSIDAVYDKGDAYTSDGDTSDLRAWTAVSGHFKTDLAKGMFRLGSTPNGAVTADVHGFFDTQGEMIQGILVERAGFDDSIGGDIDLAAMVRLDGNAREVGVYLREPNETVAQIIDGILLPRGFRTFDSNGRFTAGWIEFGTPAMTLKAPRIVSIARDRTPPPTWRIKLGYDHNWTLMQEEDLAVGTIALDRDFATNEWRNVTVEDSSILTGQPGASDSSVNTFWTNTNDAEAEAEASFDLLSETRDLYIVVAAQIQFRVRAGQTIRLEHARFGLDEGRNFILLGVAEDTKSGLTTLWCWG